MYTSNVSYKIGDLINEGNNILYQLNQINSEIDNTKFYTSLISTMAPHGSKGSIKNIGKFLERLNQKPELLGKMNNLFFKIDNFCNTHSLIQKNLTIEGNSQKIFSKFNQSKNLKDPRLKVERTIQKLEELRNISIIPNSEIASYLISINPNIGMDIKEKKTQKKLLKKKKTVKKTVKKTAKKTSSKKTMNTSIKAFICYSWDSERHKKWVLDLAIRLRGDRIDVILDQWDLKGGEDKFLFMEKSISNSDFVLLICTPIYGKKANDRKGGAGYEYQIISTEMFNKFKSKIKFICILRSGIYENSVPKYFQSKIYYDFSNMEKIEKDYKRLIRQLYDKPQHQKPKLGAKPKF